MDKIDRYFHLLEERSCSLGNILDFTFFCQEFHEFSGCELENCQTNFIIEMLVQNTKANKLTKTKSKNFKLHSLEWKDVFLFLLEKYVDKVFMLN